MSAGRADTDRVATAAAVGAGAMIAHQVAGKATRDAVFLSAFDVALLPPMILAASALSIVVAMAAARRMTRRGPSRLVPAGFALSGAASLAEWALLEPAPEAVAVALYLHMATGAGVLISGFWSLVNERFDPHTAKQKINRIAGGATAGGLLGGLFAERVAALAGASFVFPVLAALHLFCAWRVLTLRTGADAAVEATEARPDLARGSLKVLARTPYLRNLALLLTLTTAAAGLIDFVFKARADAAFAADDDAMLRFFACFYTGAALLAFLGQTSLTRMSLERLGLARTVGLLPALILAAGGFVIGLPGLVTATILRGAEAVTRNSFFRSAYELLYTPVPRADKRATKLVIDVGFDRLGDAIGAGVVAALLIAGPAVAYPLLVAAAMALSLVALLLLRSLHRGYVASLESSLVGQAMALDLDHVRDSTTRLTLIETAGALDPRDAAKARRPRAPRRDRDGAGDPAAPSASVSPPRPPSDPVLATLAELRSGDRSRIALALRSPGLSPLLAPQIVTLLAWAELQDLAAQALRGMAPRVTGLLVDALLDPDEEFATRRRIPRALRDGDPARAAAGLWRGLEDRRFEVRYQCARALSALAARHPAVRPAKGDVYAAARRELEVPPRIWAGHRLLDATERGDLAGGLAAERVDRGLEHVFTLLGLVLPARTLRLAFRGLHTDDANLRGTALEYL
ncbi:MAG: hypothetical protein CSA66_07885, partial [Proteobacteria bacterium]